MIWSQTLPAGLPLQLSAMAPANAVDQTNKKCSQWQYEPLDPRVRSRVTGRGSLVALDSEHMMVSNMERYKPLHRRLWVRSRNKVGIDSFSGETGNTWLIGVDEVRGQKPFQTLNGGVPLEMQHYNLCFSSMRPAYVS